MSKKDNASKSYLSDNKRFAQICNNQLFGGKPVIKPEKLRELDPGELPFKEVRVPELNFLEKYRDLLKSYDDKFLLLIIGFENQDGIHYAMPLRQMLYDAAEYEKRRIELAKEHKEKKDLQGAELLSGIAKTDRLIPVITLTIYWGSEPWDGAKTLHEMLDIPPVLAQYKDIINDYRINLLEVRTMENLEDYSGELKALFGFVKYQKDKAALNQFVAENETIFQSLTPETAWAISTLGNLRDLQNYMENKKIDEEEIDMGNALQEMIMDGKAEGKAEGRAEGKAEGRAVGKAETVLDFLKDLGPVPDELQAEILAQHDLAVLAKWIKLAAKAETVEEFVHKMS